MKYFVTYHYWTWKDTISNCVSNWFPFPYKNIMLEQDNERLIGLVGNASVFHLWLAWQATLCHYCSMFNSAWTSGVLAVQTNEIPIVLDFRNSTFRKSVSLLGFVFRAGSTLFILNEADLIVCQLSELALGYMGIHISLIPRVTYVLLILYTLALMLELKLEGRKLEIIWYFLFFCSFGANCLQQWGSCLPTSWGILVNQFCL